MLWSAATPRPTIIPPNTPICNEVIPTTSVVAPSSIFSAPPLIVIMAPIDACIMKKAIAAASAATSFSFFAIPIATPIAKIIGRLVKTIFPASLITWNIALNTVPGPIIPNNPYALSIVSFVKELPSPSNKPATGRIAIGSINDLPTRCKTPKILSFIFSPFKH